MDDRVRDQYLRALGVVEYRWRLDGAGVSEEAPAVVGLAEVEIPIAAERLPKTALSKKDRVPVAEQPAKIESPPATEYDPKVTSRQNSNEAIADRSVAGTAEGVSQNQSTRATGNTSRLQLLVWQPNAELLVVSEVDDTVPNTEQLKLLENLLSAIKVAHVDLYNPEPIEWPPLPTVQGGEEDIREFVSTVLTKRVEQSVVRRIILLGSTAHYWVLTSTQRAQAKEVGRCDFASEVSVALLPALPVMLDNLAAKRDAWNVLRARPAVQQALFFSGHV